MNILLIPYQQEDNLILPANLVEYVLPYAPLLPTSYTNPAIIGSLIYKNERTPIVDTAKLYDQHADSAKTKIILVSALLETTPLNYYGLLVSYSPKVINLKEENVKEIDANLPDVFYSKVQLMGEQNEQYALLPHFEQLEAAIFS